MAVALGGIFGNIYGQYSQLANARFWNTKSYDYPIVVNKGEVSQNAINEFTSANKTSLFVATNKTGYENENNGYVNDSNQIYQIRNLDGTINNKYYVDQETGNVYLRPDTLSRNSSIENFASGNISPLDTVVSIVDSPPYTDPNLLTPGASSITGRYNYNWGSTISPGNRVNIFGEYTIDGVNWQKIPGTVKTLDSSTGGNAFIDFTVPVDTLNIKWTGTVETDPPGTYINTYNHTYQHTNLVAGPNNSNMSGVFDLSTPAGGTATADLTLKYVWNLPPGTPINSSVNLHVEYSTDGGTNWSTLAGSNHPITTPGSHSTPPEATITVNNLPPAVMTANTRFRVVSDLTASSPGTQITTLGPDTHQLALPPDGVKFSPNPPAPFYGPLVSYDLSDAVNPTTLTFATNWFFDKVEILDDDGNPTGNYYNPGQVDLVVEYNDAGTWKPVPNTSTTLTDTGASTLVANFTDLSSVNAIGNANANFRVKAVVTQGVDIPIEDESLDYFTDSVADPEPEGTDIIVNGHFIGLKSDRTDTKILATPPANALGAYVTLDGLSNGNSIKGRLEYTTNGTTWNGITGTEVNTSVTMVNDQAILNNQAISIPPGIANPTNFTLRFIEYYDFIPGFTNTNKMMDPLIGTFQPRAFSNITVQLAPSSTNISAYQGQSGYFDSDITNNNITPPPGTNLQFRYEYSTNGGSTWTSAGSLVTIPAGSTGHISGNITNIPANTLVRIGQYTSYPTTSNLGNVFKSNVVEKVSNSTTDVSLQGINHNAIIDSDLLNTSGQTLYAKYEYFNGSTWVDYANTTISNGSSAHLSATIPNIVAGNRLRVGIYKDAAHTTHYTGNNFTLSNKVERYYKNIYNDLKVLVTQKFSDEPQDLPKQVLNDTTTEINKTYLAAAELPSFSSTLNNLKVVKNTTLNPGTPPVYQNGNFTLKANYDDYASITLPVGVKSNPNEAQYFGSSFYLDEVPKPEEFGLNSANNIKIKSANPALFTTFPTGSTINDYSKADYLELIVNGVSIAVGNLDTSKIPAIVPGTNPESALYRFSTNFTGGDLDFSKVKGDWSIDTSLESPTNPTGGKYITDARGYTERYNESMFNKLPLDNFVISTDIYVDDVDPGANPYPIGSATNFAGIRIRATNPGDPINQSGYLIAYENNQIKILKGDQNVATFNTNIPTFGNGTNRNLKVHANGNDIKVYVDNNFVGEYIDPFYSYTSGYTSLVTTGRKVGYDNLAISSYASPVQLLSQALKKGENSIVVKTFGDKNTIVDVGGIIGGVDLKTLNTPPDLKALNGGINEPDINSYLYKQSSITGLHQAELDKKKSYWSASIASSLGIAGMITFKNKEGGSIHKTKEEFSKVNSMMSNLTSLLGAIDDTFNSHLNIIR